MIVIQMGITWYMLAIAALALRALVTHLYVQA